MLREQAQRALLGDGLLAEDAPLSALNDLPDQLAAATAPAVRGTAANERLRGTNDDELIQGLAGNDTLIGRRGADRLLGQAGDDNLIGGGGDDTLIGAAGNDRLKGGGGSDSLKGGGGDDTLLGGGGADTLKGGGGEDSLNGGGGGDFLAGGGKSDTLDGSRGDDTLKGGGGDDLILGGVGSDQIVGGGGADTIRYRNADFAKGEVDVIVGFKTGEDKVDLSAVAIPAEGLGFVLIDGSIALEIAGGRLVFRGIADPGLLAAEDFVLPDGAAPFSFTLPTPVAENRTPTVSAAVEGEALETDSAYTIDLLSGASDPDEGDVLSISDLTLTSGDTSGISFTGAALDVDPAAYQRLAAGEAEIITYAYKISDDDDAFAAQTATVTIFGVNDVPATAGPVTATASEDDADFIVDLLMGAADPDAGADLSVDGVTLVSGDDRGVVFNGVALEVEPGAYSDLGADEVVTIVFRYNVADGLGGIAAQTATITINGHNDAPTVAAKVRGGGAANGETFSVNLLDGARDADARDSLTISDLRVISGDASGVQKSSDSLIVDPSAYVGLSGGQDVEIVYAYAIADAFGATVAQTATVTIIGVNDAPVTVGPIAATASEDDAGFIVDLLLGAADPDASADLSVEGLTLVSGNARGIAFITTALKVDPGAYTDLGADDVEIIVFRYVVTDGAGGIAAQTATITINGRNDAPTVAAEVRAGSVAQGAVFTVDLLDGARDADTGETLTISGLRVISGDASGVLGNGDFLTVDPSAYTGLSEDQDETIVYTYAVVDGSGASAEQTATITIAGANNAPVIADPVLASASEDDAGFIVDLLEGATDPDAVADLSVDGLTLVSGDDRGAVFTGTALEVDPGAYNDLCADEVETIVFRYNVKDGLGGIAAQTATITINGRNDAPTVTAEVRGGGAANGGAFSIDLLDGARDADTGDTLAITGLRVVSGDASGVQENEGSLFVDPSVYSGLGEDQGEEIVFAYAIVDGSGASVEQTATIAIAGANDAPSVPGQLSAEASEDDVPFVVDLLQGASDPDAGELLSVANFTRVSGDPAGVVLKGNRLDVDPADYNRLSAGENETIIYGYDVTDGKGGIAAQFVTITITGVNDAPVASSELREGGSESGDNFTVDLLDGAADPDARDILSVQGVTLASGEGSGVTIGASSLSVDVSAYESLGLGDVETIRYSYQISDGVGGVVSRAAEVTIFGENDAPVITGPVTIFLTESDAPRVVNLLRGASDPDRGDDVSIANLSLTGGDDAGASIVGDTLTVSPGFYSSLIVGEREVITYAYDLVDGNGGATPQTAEISIGGVDTFRSFFDTDLGAEIEGSPEQDRIFGNGGDDTIIGGASDDSIFGGADNDVIGTSVGADRLSGGPGQDEFVIRFADEVTEQLDTTPDIIIDFNLLFDTLDFRKVIEPTDSFETTVSFSYNALLDQTTVNILETPVVILEGISQSFQTFLNNGILAFDRANFQFSENNFGLANETFVNGPESTILLPELEEDEFYEIKSSTGGGELFFSSEGIVLKPINLDLDPTEGGVVSAVIIHFDEFGVEATTEVSWSVRPEDQPPTFAGETFTVSENATEFSWNLTDFVEDDFFGFGFFEDAFLAFDIASELDFGTVTINANGETSALGGPSIFVRENETVTTIFTLGEDVPDVREDETVSVDIEFAVRDPSFAFIFATFTIDIQGAPDALDVDNGPLVSTFQFDGDVDTFVVQLEEGVEYAFEARGADTGEGTVADPILTLLDDSFNFIAQDDNSGVGENSLIMFTPDRTALFNLQVQSTDLVAGDYVVEATRPDDFGETFATAGQTSPGQFVFGQLETPGDLDFVSVFLDAGANYQFDLLGEPSGAGTLSDPYLRLRNKDGIELAFNDDHIDFNGDFSLESQIVFTPTVSEAYLLVVDSFQSILTGSWQLSTFEFS